MKKTTTVAGEAAKTRAALTLARGAIEALITLGVDRKKMALLLPTILEDISERNADSYESFPMLNPGFFERSSHQFAEEEAESYVAFTKHDKVS